MKSDSRPLSPHLQVYRFKLHMAMSIMHRITGVGLVIGLLLMIYWLGAAAHGPEAYADATGFIGSWFGYLLLLGFSVSLFYHLCSGIRHLIWDAGHMMTIEATQKSGVVVLAATAVLTVLAWILALAI